MRFLLEDLFTIHNCEKWIPECLVPLIVCWAGIWMGGIHFMVAMFFFHFVFPPRRLLSVVRPCYRTWRVIILSGQTKALVVSRAYGYERREQTE